MTYVPCMNQPVQLAGADLSWRSLVKKVEVEVGEAEAAEAVKGAVEAAAEAEKQNACLAWLVELL